MEPGRSKLALALALLAVALVAWLPRTRGGLRHAYGPPAEPDVGWFSLDPDGLYHTRRVERVFQEGLPVAGTDPYLDHPHGAAIPWPPYYDLALWALLAPFAPQDAEARRPFLERWVATLPSVWAVLTALAAAGAGWLLGGAVGALAAGCYATLGWGAINYSRVGSGDHHAWVTLLHALLLLALSAALAGGALRARRRAWAWGAACGALVGLLIGSWVAALLYLLEAQLVLAWLLVRRGREELPGVAPLGLALHLAALLVLAPAVLASPWKQAFPWMVVNLSWFHLGFLALGALVFVPLALAPPGLAPGRPWARRYPAAVALALALLALALWALDAPPARGMAEGFAWVSRADAFMDTVLESEPLVGPRAAAGELFLALGYGVLLLPLAWGFAVWRAFARGELGLLPWVVAAPPLLVQALQQRRFSEAAIVPIAVVLGWGAARACARLRAPVAAPLALGLALLLHVPALRRAGEDFSAADSFNVGKQVDWILGERRLADWIRAEGPGPTLAHWDRGHLLEWAADSPTVATNFGSYIGLDSYADPARFFLAEDDPTAREVLARRGIRYVFVPASLPRNVPSMLRIARTPAPERILRTAPGGGARAGEAWPATMAARLLHPGARAAADGAGAGEPGPPGFLRLVHVSPYVNPGYRDPATGAPSPAGFVYEHVPGALLEARGAPGKTLELALRLRFEPADRELVVRERAEVGNDGVARARVPYATDVQAGDARVVSARWTLDGRGGALEVPEQAIAEGATLRLE